MLKLKNVFSFNHKGYSYNYTNKGEFVALLDKDYDDQELLSEESLNALKSICLMDKFCEKPKIACRGLRF